MMENKVNSEPVPGSSNNTGVIKKKKDEKRSKRDQRSWENLMKNTSSLSEAEKLDVIKEKYFELYNDYKTTISTLKTTEKQMIMLQKEKEHVQADLTKNILSRSKMESLARELQRQNKEIKFQERETHLANMNRQMELQKKLSETQLKKLEVEFETERKIWQKERSILVANLERSDETNMALQENVKGLQEHLDSYQKQYSDFETTMRRSNKVFDSFKEEMTKMQKANSTLEKDRNEWHTKWQSNTKTLVKMSETQQKCITELRNAERKIIMLDKLCRKLQVERAAYIAQLKQNNLDPVTPTPQPEDEATVVPGPSSENGKSSKERELLALKKELKNMVGQIKEFTEKVPQADGEKLQDVLQEHPRIACDNETKPEKDTTSITPSSSCESSEPTNSTDQTLDKKDGRAAKCATVSSLDTIEEGSLSDQLD